MIKGVNGGTTQWIEVTGGSSPTIPYVSSSSSNPIEGMIRISGSDFQVYANGMWTAIGGGYTTVSVTPYANSVLTWASKKMEEEQERERMAKDNPALQNALAAIKRAEDNFTLLSKFVEHDRV
jgi:hypothetical protein